MKIRQSVCLPMLWPAEVPLGEFLSALTDIGYPAVEIWNRDERFDELVTLCQGRGLTIASMIGHGSINRGLNDIAQHDRIERASFMNLSTSQRAAGFRASSASPAIAATVRGLRRVAPYAEEKGVNLNLELLNSKIDHAGYQCDHTAWGVAVCEQVGSPRVKLLYDIYHMQIMEGDIIHTIRDNIQWIGHFHTAGVPSRHDIDDSQELAYGAICDTIARTDYDLYVGHEFKPGGDAVQALRNAYAICNCW